MRAGVREGGFVEGELYAVHVKPESRDPKAETRDTKSETRDPRPQTRDPKPGTLGEDGFPKDPAAPEDEGGCGNES